MRRSGGQAHVCRIAAAPSAIEVEVDIRDRGMPMPGAYVLGQGCWLIADGQQFGYPAYALFPFQGTPPQPGWPAGFRVPRRWPMSMRSLLLAGFS
jgi:hypothetical protein